MTLIPAKKLRQGSDKWHAMRLDGIGASEVSALFPMERPGYAMSAYTLRLVKRREIPAESVFVGDAKLAADGLFQEPAIAGAIAHINGFKIERGGYAIDDQQPLMRCSLDYIIPEPNDYIRKLFGSRKINGPGVFQIKSVIIHQFRNHWTKESAPPYTVLQVQQEVACMGYEWGLIGIRTGDDATYHVYPVFPAKGRGDEIREMIGRFWRKCVEGDHIPPIDHTESTRLAIRAELPPRLFQPNMHNFEDDIEIDEACLAFDLAGQERKRADEEYARAVNVLHRKLGPILQAYSLHWWISQSVSDNRRTIRVKRRNYQADENDG